MFPLALTTQQRQTILDSPRVSPRIVERLHTGHGSEDALNFSRAELDQFADELSEIALEATEPNRRLIVAVINRIDELLDATGRDLRQPPRRPRPALDVELLFQFKVTLLDLTPAVWRRFQMPDGSLADLHHAIQAAFGWQDQRQHRFVIDGIAYGRPPALDVGFGWGSDAMDEGAVRLSELAPVSGRRARWVYEYDSRDEWRHEVLFEGYPPKQAGQVYPFCCGGELAAPPEGVGGPWGYAEFLESLGHAPQGEPADHQKTVDYFDPEAFDAEKATCAMQKTASNPSREAI